MNPIAIAGLSFLLWIVSKGEFAAYWHLATVSNSVTGKSSIATGGSSSVPTVATTPGTINTISNNPPVPPSTTSNTLGMTITDILNAANNGG